MRFHPSDRHAILVLVQRVMNEETFTGYLKAFSALHKVPYEELKTLVHQYPYCQNLHHLFLEKSKLEDHEHLDKNLQRAATHTNNRSFLFKKLRQIVEKEKAEDSVVAHEEFLELPNLNALGTPLPPISKSIEAAVPTPPPLSFSNIEKQPESILDPEANFTPTDVSPDASKTNHSMQAHPEPKQEPSQSNSGSTVIEEVVPAIATTLRVLDAIIFRPQN
ncbi:MAG: hypothetical protein HRU40_15920, partial [Saprospiraceae bacterium]|nr:hypothetical protein [Saprospiraceae bacterium]